MPDNQRTSAREEGLHGELNSGFRVEGAAACRWPMEPRSGTLESNQAGLAYQTSGRPTPTFPGAPRAGFEPASTLVNSQPLFRLSYLGSSAGVCGARGPSIACAIERPVTELEPSSPRRQRGVLAIERTGRDGAEEERIQGRERAGVPYAWRGPPLDGHRRGPAGGRMRWRARTDAAAYGGRAPALSRRLRLSRPRPHRRVSPSLLPGGLSRPAADDRSSRPLLHVDDPGGRRRIHARAGAGRRRRDRRRLPRAAGEVAHRGLPAVGQNGEARRALPDAGARRPPIGGLQRLLSMRRARLVRPRGPLHRASRIRRRSRRRRRTPLHHRVHPSVRRVAAGHAGGGSSGRPDTHYTDTQPCTAPTQSAPASAQGTSRSCGTSAEQPTPSACTATRRRTNNSTVRSQFTCTYSGADPRLPCPRPSTDGMPGDRTRSLAVKSRLLCRTELSSRDGGWPSLESNQVFLRVKQALCPVSYSAVNRWKRMTGVEPASSSLATRRSTVRASSARVEPWQGRQDSNLDQLGWSQPCSALHHVPAK